MLPISAAYHIFFTFGCVSFMGVRARASPFVRFVSFAFDRKSVLCAVYKGFLGFETIVVCPLSILIKMQFGCIRLQNIYYAFQNWNQAWHIPENW